MKKMKYNICLFCGKCLNKIGKKNSTTFGVFKFLFMGAILLSIIFIPYKIGSYISNHSNMTINCEKIYNTRYMEFSCSCAQEIDKDYKINCWGIGCIDIVYFFRYIIYLFVLYLLYLLFKNMCFEIIEVSQQTLNDIKIENHEY